MEDEIKCSKCGSSKVIDITYGYPSGDMVEQHMNGEIYLGGCCIEDYQPVKHCCDCEEDFGGEEMSDEVKLLCNTLGLMSQQERRADDKLIGQGGYINIFELVNAERYEVRTHSNMIFMLLSPYSKHLKNDTYLKLFLEEINVAEKYLNSIWRVEREKIFDDGRIDFVLECDEICIAIEMKIDACDQPEQLKRYENYAKSKLKPKGLKMKKVRCEDYFICYLTLDGHNPSAQSIKGMDSEKLINISFSQHIVNWLKRCLEVTDDKLQVYSALKQYLILIEKLIKEESEDLEMAELLMNSENYRAYLKLKEEEKTAKKLLVIKFCDELSKRLPLGFEKGSDDFYYNSDEFYDSTGNGVGFSYMTDKTYTDKNENVFNVEVTLDFYNNNDGALSIGYALYNKKTNKYMKYPKNTDCIFEHFGMLDYEFYEINDEIFLAWEYLLSNDEYYSFKELTAPVINMFDNVGMETEMSNILSWVKGYLLKIEVRS